MDRAYEGNETRQLALDLGFIPVVPPIKTRLDPWEYDREMYKQTPPSSRLTLIRPPKSAVIKPANTLQTLLRTT